MTREHHVDTDAFIELMAKQLGVPKAKVRRILLGIGMATIQNQAERLVASENWDKPKGSLTWDDIHRAPTLRQFGEVVRTYLP